MAGATKSMQPATYIESRQLLDKQLGKSLSYVYYLALLSSIALVTFCFVNPNGLMFMCSFISLGTLVADVVIAVKGNLPLNKTINSWSNSEYPANWQEYRSRWFRFYTTRQTLNVIGFISLLTGIIFGL
jgi:hypothetical protein